MSSSWAYFYQSSNLMNDFGKEKSEWFLLIDGLIFLPFLCFCCIEDKKEAAIKALVYACIIILLGSYVLPENAKFIWHYLESGRYVVLAVFILLEVTTIFTVLFAIKAALTKETDPDRAISQPIENIVGKGLISLLLSFEARIWTYALFSKKINRNYFTGDKHFSCHRKDDTQSNQLGFILLILFELPLTHIVIHFLWSDVVANVITIVTLFGLAFFIAEYKAIAIRPISVTSQNILVRYGILNPLTIPLSDIVSVQLNNQFIYRASHIKRFNLSGCPNVEIKLNSGQLIYLGLDAPEKFISALDFSVRRSGENISN